MHRGNVIELIDYALSKLRAGKTPGQIKTEIHFANAGWSPVEINRALAAAIVQLQAEQQKQETEPFEAAPAEMPMAVEIPRGNQVAFSEGVNGQPNLEQKLAEITAQNELENQGNQAVEQDKENKYSIAFPGDELVFNAANNWGILAALVLALVMLIVVVILVLKIA